MIRTVKSVPAFFALWTASSLLAQSDLDQRVSKEIPESAIRTGVKAMISAALDLLKK